MASWVLIGFLNISWSHLHDRTFVHSLVLPPALKFYPPPDRNFLLLQIATFAEGKFNCICRAVVSDFFTAILFGIPAEQFWWNIDLIVVKSLLLWPWVTLFFYEMKWRSSSTVAILSFSVTRTCIAERVWLSIWTGGVPATTTRPSTWSPLSVRCVLIRNALLYDHCTASPVYFVISFFLKGWTSKGRRWEQHIWDSVNATLPSQSSCVIFRFRLWKRGFYHRNFFRQTLLLAPLMAARTVTSWEPCLRAMGSRCPCLLLDSSCHLVKVLIEAQLSAQILAIQYLTILTSKS